MNIAGIQSDWKVERIEFAKLTGERARSAGANGRIGIHGKTCSVDIARITIDGQRGYGSSIRISPEWAETLIGQRLVDLFDDLGRLKEEYRLQLEYPILDWLGQRFGKPVYELEAGTHFERGVPLIVPCYDTSLYFDDLHLPDESSAVALMQEQAKQGYDKGHRHFKIKVGRGGRHMPLWEGTKRDIAIVQGISEVAGPTGKIMIDANNAYNLNLTKEVLAALSDVNLYWLEEAFHEDDALYEDLKDWLRNRGQQVLIADGEGLASPHLVDWAIRGRLDVLQYDIIWPGFTHWLELGQKLDAHGLRSAPHCYGNAYGIYVSGHLSAGVRNFEFVEYDDITIEGMDVSGYRVDNGEMHIPASPGFGIVFDDELVSGLVKRSGWSKS
ncbi:enolase C-terminal domain-like protein [Paenibacillus sp. CF384]|uniref:enolase C-terminal domain-like protein n=1 Tax=Paenibacillus sp. CF384 TaxID=1884382 RepID=UPI000896A1C3|nr:enolase C-terminal domain-like protein [Paenibacillus sp. CF384]SDW03005.1 L-alanine-DL-glutamate epimerase [Paenibacillus sp. CF384]